MGHICGAMDGAEIKSQACWEDDCSLHQDTSILSCPTDLLEPSAVQGTVLVRACQAADGTGNECIVDLV